MILVVGGTGQVGSAVVRGLQGRGASVAAFLRPATDGAAVAAAGVRIARGDLRDPSSLRAVCDGVDCVVATANTIVPRRGEHADFDAIAGGYAELGRVARAAGVRRFVFVSVPRSFMGRGAPDFDAKARAEEALAAEGPPLLVVRPSLIMETWLPWLGSRVPLRGRDHPTLERGFWLAQLAGRALHHSVDRFGIALLFGDGSARHAFIASDDVAEALAAAALNRDQNAGEKQLGGPEILTWRDAADAFGRAFAMRVRSLRQGTAVPRLLASVTRRISPATAQIFASQAIVATVDSPYPADTTRQLLGRDPISVEAFLRRASATRSAEP
jgi:uncharacterized protein YbjT (DUF2867 family)